MSLHANRREIDGVIILDLQGRLTLGPETAKFQSELESILAAGETKLLLNLKELGTIDSTGLGFLVLAHSNLQRAGGSTKLVHLSTRHLDLLVLTKLNAVFQIFDDEQTAIDSFFPDRELRAFDILQFVKSQRSKTERSAETTDNGAPHSSSEEESPLDDSDS